MIDPKNKKSSTSPTSPTSSTSPPSTPPPLLDDPAIIIPSEASEASTSTSTSTSTTTQQQQQPAPANASPGFLHHLTYPLAYTTSALLRRLSEDSAPTPLARALSANYNGIMTDPTTGVFHPPQRRLSPFQPPPLTPLTLDGYRDSTSAQGRLLSKALAEEIRLLVPPRLQLCDQWQLSYSLEQDGSSLRMLYSLLDKFRGKRGGFVLVVKDAAGGVFGAYLSDPPYPHAHYYGTGESFLWRAHRLPLLPDLASLPPPPSADTTHMTRMTTIGAAKDTHLNPHTNTHHTTNGTSTSTSRSGTSTPERIRFKAFPYTGENDFTILCSQGFLSVGGGDGHYGLWLNDNLAKGVSGGCPTFGNEELSDEGEKFEILGVEVWYIGS